MNAFRNSLPVLLLAALVAAPAYAQRGGAEGRSSGAVGPNGSSGSGAASYVERAPSMSMPSSGRSSYAEGSGAPRPGRSMSIAMPTRPNNAPAVKNLTFFRDSRVVVPPRWWPMAEIVPDFAYWGGRGIMAEIQWLSRAGFVPVTPVDPTTVAVEDYAYWPAGWKAYGFALPPGGRLQVEVEHTKLGWFRLMAVDKWGTPGPGMLQAQVAYRPVMITVSNPGKVASAVYIVVDDPGWWSSKEDPYRLVIRKDWDPALVDLSSVKLVSGLWGASPSNSAQFSGPSRTGPAVFPY